VSPAREDNKFWDRFFETPLGPYGRPHQSLLEIHDFQTAYDMDQGGVQCGSGRDIPRDGQVRGNMYEGEEYDSFGKSHPLTRYTAGQISVMSFSCMLWIQCMESFTRTGPSVTCPAAQGVILSHEFARLSPILVGMSRWECFITLTGCWHFGQNANSDFLKSLFNSIFVIPTVSFRRILGMMM
jgi:hypothetical protein